MLTAATTLLKNIDPTGLYDWDASLGGSATDDELRSKDGKDKATRRRDSSHIVEETRTSLGLSAEPLDRKILC